MTLETRAEPVGLTEPIEVGPLFPNEAMDTHPTLWDTIVATFPDVSVGDATKMVALITGVCPSCYDAPKSCQCWNDE